MRRDILLRLMVAMVLFPASTNKFVGRRPMSIRRSRSHPTDLTDAQ